jgi:serine protease Do
VILEMNGKKIQTYDAFRMEIATMKPGSSVRLNGLREGKPLELTVTLGERPGAVAQGQKSAEEPVQTLGLQVQNLTKELADQLGYQLGEGVVVTAVQPGGPAAEEGIQRGDLILSVNRHNVNDAKEFSDAVKQARKAGKVLFLIRRGDASQFVVVPFE